MEALSRYLREEKLSQAQFGARVGVSQRAVSYWIAGKVKPSLAIAARIERATEERVPMAAWVDNADA